MLTKELIRQVRRIEIKTRKLVDENLAGKYHTAFKGQGMEFAEVRPYQPGDDIRSIDWNVTARAGEPFIKKFAEERELTVMMLVDMSGSTEFGSGAKSKRALAAELTALFAFSAIRNQDKVGCMIFTDKVELFITPKKGRKHVLRLIREILAFRPRGLGTDISEALRHFALFQKRKSVVFLISDFMDQNYLKSLQQVAGRHDLVAVSIQDRIEMQPPKRGLMMLEDGETGREICVDFSSPMVQSFLSAKVEGFREELQQNLRRAQVDRIQISSDHEYEKELIKFFKMRELRR